MRQPVHVARFAELPCGRPNYYVGVESMRESNVDGAGKVGRDVAK